MPIQLVPAPKKRNTTKLKEIPEEDDFFNSEKSSSEDLTRSNPKSEDLNTKPVLMDDVPRHFGENHMLPSQISEDALGGPVHFGSPFQ